MARVLEPIKKEVIKRMTLANVRSEYYKLSDFYTKIINQEIVYCPNCGEWKRSEAFYAEPQSVDGIEHFACKECILDMCTDYDPKNKTRTDNKEKTINTFKKLDWYFNERVYLDQFETITEDVGERVRGTAVQQWIVTCRSLHQYRGLRFDNSEFLGDTEAIMNSKNRTPRKEIIRIFGDGFTNDDYLYLQDQYDDWCSRTQVDTKSQEIFIVQICFIQLEIYKARKNGRDAEKLIKQLNDTTQAANLQPRQNVGNTSTDNLTFGQLIEKWEQEKPIPEPTEEFKDVDGIGKYIRVWFKGHLCRALGIDNGYSREYDEYIKKYTVEKPNYSEEGNSEDIYNAVFGKETE